MLIMAHPCVSHTDPPIVRSGNKESEETADSETMPQALDDVDLEEGEIIDSGGEEDCNRSDKNNALEEIMEQEQYDDLEIAGKKKKRKKRKKKKDEEDGLNDLGKPKKKKRYIDHDHVSDDETWFPMNSMPYSKKGINRLLDDGTPSPSEFCDFSPERRSSPSQDEDEIKEEKQPKMRKMLRKTVNRRQNLEKGLKKKRKDIMNRGDSKKRGMLNKNKRKIQKVKTRPLCKFFLEGRCSKGADCPFSHSSQPAMKKELCKFYVNGYCAKGLNCLYMHNEFPCKFYHTGAKCYSESNCLFSHDPLNEETRKLLDKYLAENNQEEKDEVSGSEDTPSSPKPQQKRPSLLGSPPRHVKEAAETWRWQQHVFQMQKKRYPGQRNAPIMSPPQSFSRPNFYMDTLPRSPLKIPSLISMPPIPMPPLNPSVHLSSQIDPFPTVPEDESNSQDEWENKCNSRETELRNNPLTSQGKDSKSSPSVSGDNLEKQDQSITKDVEKIKEELLTRSGMNNSDDTKGQEDNQQLAAQLRSNSPPAESGLFPPPTVPTHLPRRQRELYLRIQQHQKEAASGDSGTDGGDNSEDPEGKTEDEKKENWYSSDEDDTEDQPLTALLKKLGEMPPPNKPNPNLGQAFPANTTIDITKMLSEIRNQATQKPRVNGNNLLNQDKDFWKNLFSGVENANAQKKQDNRDPRIRSQNPPLLEAPNKSPPFRDPRLQNRDPRLARDPRVSSANVSNSTVIGSRIIPEKAPAPPPPLPPPQVQIWDMPPILTKPIDIIENSKGIPVVGNIPYKLHKITQSQPNYSTYVFQCQSDPKLLNDPRLKKYFKQMSGLLRQQQHLTIDSSVVQSKKKNHLEEQIKSNVNTVDNQKTSTNVDVWDQLPKQKAADPRALKLSSSNLFKSRQMESVSSPHISSLEPNWTSSVVNPTSSTTTVSSSPTSRSIIDPRLIKLLHPPSDHKLLSHSLGDQIQSDLESNSSPSQKKQTDSTVTATSSVTLTQNTQLPTAIKDTPSPPSSVSTVTVKDEPVEETKSEDVDKKLGEEKDAEKKKKMTSFNRKTSMDYASPLSSYEDSSNSNTSYNSYNRRPQVSQTSASVQLNIPQQSSNTSPVSADVGLAQDSSDHSSLPFLASEPPVEQIVPPEHTPSLKEVFKTIDPTASPFC